MKFKEEYRNISLLNEFGDLKRVKIIRDDFAIWNNNYNIHVFKQNVLIYDD
jgi:hypothetical protein